MTTPRDPRNHGASELPDDLERRLRASLDRHAVQAPDGGLVAERILHAADRASARTPRRRHVGWGPSLAAAAVLFVIGGVVLAVTQLGSSNRQDTAAATGARTSPRSAALSSSKPAPQVVAPSSSSATSTQQSKPSTLHDITLIDLTFNGTNSGWGLGSADCVNGPGRCTALVHTSDGVRWTSHPNTPFNVPGVNGCATLCVSHIRFATPDVGYVYGPDAFFMTTDGGANWVQQGTVGVLALESLDGNVVRVSTNGADCAHATCDVRLQTSAIGGTTWTTAASPALPARTPVDVSLSRGDSDVYALFASHSDTTMSQLYHSGNDGQTWTNLGEACPHSANGLNYGTVVAAAPDGRVSVLCQIHQMGGSTTVATSTDHGAHFTSRSSRGVGAYVGYLAGDPVTVLAAGGDGLTYSLDGGDTWATVPGIDQVTFVGFEDPTVGRALADGGRTIWTTRDAGRTWTKVSLG